MYLQVTPLSGVWHVAFPARADERGSFRRFWCADVFKEAGLEFTPWQASLSANRLKYTLRGMHWQDGSHAEQKLVRCVRGSIWDVALDLRPDSPTFCHWHAEVLDEENGTALFLPRGVAHGFLSLTDDAVVAYLIDAPYSPSAAKGSRWNDPAFAIEWPRHPAVISLQDQNWPDFTHG